MFYKKIYLILFCVIGVISLYGQSILEDIGYSQEKIFPINIDRFGFPNVEISIADTSYWIIWDTGNMIGLVLSENIISHNDFTFQDSIKLYDSEGSFAGTSYTYSHQNIEILNKYFKNIEITSTEKIMDGFLGPKFLESSVFTLDYTNKVIGISYSIDEIDISKGNKVPLVRSTAFPYLIIVEGRLQGQSILIELDTGKTRTVIDPEMIPMFNLKTSSRGVVVEDLNIAGINISFTNGKMKNFKGISESLPSPIRIGLGSDFLKNYIFSADYQNGFVTLLPIK